MPDPGARPDLDRLAALAQQILDNWFEWDDEGSGYPSASCRYCDTWRQIRMRETTQAFMRSELDEKHEHDCLTHLAKAIPALLAHCAAVEGENERLTRLIAETRDAIFAMIPGEDFSMDETEHYELLTETLLTRLYDRLLNVAAARPTPDPAAGAAVERERCARLVESATMVAGPDAGEVERSLTMGINFLLASIAVDIRAARSGG